MDSELYRRSEDLVRMPGRSTGSEKPTAPATRGSGMTCPGPSRARGCGPARRGCPYLAPGRLARQNRLAGSLEVALEVIVQPDLVERTAEVVVDFQPPAFTKDPGLAA